VGWVKLNANAYFRAANGDGGMGVIIRDDEGKVLLTTWRTLRNLASAEAVEAEACLEGVRLATQWIRQPLQVELDCQLLIEALNKEGENISLLVGVIAKIKGYSLLLLDCRFTHIRRNANQVADGLAQLGVERRGLTMMRFQAPSAIQTLLDRETPGNARWEFCNTNSI
jgi:hypothetical protein